MITHLKCLFDRLEFGHERGYCKDCREHGGVAVSETVVCESPFNDINIFLEGRGFKVFHQNINGLVKKVQNIEMLLEKTKRKINIMGLSETHLYEGIPDEIVDIDGYIFLRSDRKLAGEVVLDVTSEMTL